MKRHDLTLDEALRQFLIEEDAGTPVPNGWLKGPSLPEYEAHVRGTKPFTPDQMEWVRNHPACLATLGMFEQHIGNNPQQESRVALAPEIPENVRSEVTWDSGVGRGRISFDFGGAAFAGKLIFLNRVGRGLAGVLRLDSGGRGVFASLPAGEYGMLPSLMSGSLAGLTIAGRFEGQAQPTEVAPLLLEQKRDLEHGLHASVRVFGAEAEIAFTTANPELEGAKVHIAFVRPETGNVELSGEVALEKHPMPPKRWVGNWQYPLNFTGRLEIVFAVEKK